jgi:hypothetical protein
MLIRESLPYSQKSDHRSKNDQQFKLIFLIGKIIIHDLYVYYNIYIDVSKFIYFGGGESYITVKNNINQV